VCARAGLPDTIRFVLSPTAKRLPSQKIAITNRRYNAVKLRLHFRALSNREDASLDSPLGPTPIVGELKLRTPDLTLDPSTERDLLFLGPGSSQAVQLSLHRQDLPEGLLGHLLVTASNEQLAEVPIEATVASLAPSLPGQVCLGLAPVGKPSSATFELHNPSDVTVAWRCHSPAPFGPMRRMGWSRRWGWWMRSE
jgi:hypothetical protein